jgi:AAA15 family ATPase/GTPase
MLIEFTTKNFRSLKDEATLSMVAEKLKSNKQDTVSLSNDVDLLPVAGVFGPNASGKSNLLKALFFLKIAVEHTNHLNVPVFSNPLLQPFKLDKNSDLKPSYFQIVLWDKNTQSEYRYGFETTKKKIVSEWLTKSSKVSKNVTEKELFTREGSEIKLHKSMDKKPESLINKVHPNSLALTVFAQFANKEALTVFDIIKDKLFISDGTFDLHQLLNIAFSILRENPSYKDRLLEFLKESDIAIENLKLNKSIVEKGALEQMIKGMPPGLAENFTNQDVFSEQILTSHKVYDGSGKMSSFEMSDFESTGTQRLFGLGTILLQVLDRGGVLVIDEFGNSLHPFISREIIRIFQNKKLNPNNAQLLFSSHDTFLLSSKGSNFRRDQIWFTEKDKKEQGSLHSLAEYKTKSDLKIAKNYLEGRFGAVPVTTFES